MFNSHNADARQVTTNQPISCRQSGRTPLDTETLVQLVKSKSERGFNVLYDNYSGALYGILMKFVQRREVADDLLQEIFIKIWKNIEGYEPERGSLFTWMLNIARNQAIDYLRSTCHKNELLHVNNDLFSLRQDYISSPDTGNTAAECKDIRSKIVLLDQKYADIIDLIFFYGCTQEQTARILKIPLGTVKTRARKGISILKMLYQP